MTSPDLLAEARAERDRLRAVLDGIEDGILAVDGEQRVVLSNPAAEQLLAASEPPDGRLLTDLLPRGVADKLLRAAAAGRPFQAEVELKTFPRRRLAVSARPRGQSSLIVLRDVTELRQLERVRQDFVANVSHELRTPITVVQTHAETLLDAALEEPDAARRFVEAIHRHAIRLSRLVSDLLDLSRIEAGSRTLEPQPFNVRAVADTVAASLGERGQVALSVHVDPALVAYADEDAVDQVLLNLMDNALKYTPAGGSVEVQARRVEGRRVRVEIRDDGQGVPPKHRPRLFERFYRVDKGRSREAGGTGLGLSIVKHLVESMGGRVGYTARQPAGSIFWLELPLAEGVLLREGPGDDT